MRRREFLKTATLAAGVPVAVGGFMSSAASATADEPKKTAPPLERPKETKRGDMRYRELGSTGQEVSMVGLGGFHIGKQHDEAESIRIIRSAIDAGITFMDNCWDYNDGASEIRMGKALRDGYREKVFLMTKIDGRTRGGRQAARRIPRPPADGTSSTCCSIHEMIRIEDPDRIFAEGGAMEALVAAKQAGKIRFIGFTGHKDPHVHLRMLEVAEQHGFHFDTVQMPLNVMDAHFRSFAKKVVPRALEQGIGVLGMKSMGSGEDHPQEPGGDGRWSACTLRMSLPTSVVITGIDSMKILEQALEAVRTFEPLTDDQVAALLKKTTEAAATGKFELFKTNTQFRHHSEAP